MSEELRGVCEVCFEPLCLLCGGCPYDDCPHGPSIEDEEDEAKEAGDEQPLGTPAG